MVSEMRAAQRMAARDGSDAKGEVYPSRSKLWRKSGGAKERSSAAVLHLPPLRRRGGHKEADNPHGQVFSRFLV